MKTFKHLWILFLVSVGVSSCYNEVIVEEGPIPEPAITLNQLLTSYDLWYVNINETTGPGEIPFLQTAFTVSFDFGVLLANNNLVGIGSTGNGLGIDIGGYNTLGTTLEVQHDIDGFWRLEVFQLGHDRLRIYHRPSNTSYYLTGYQRNEFDYDLLFYDNIHYFLQEYAAWEKTFTSDFGALNEFDAENFLQFLIEGGNGDVFRSSIDQNGTRIDTIFWDYEGFYEVFHVQGDPYVKTLTLDYDFLNNDFFELVVIDDRTIELLHPASGTLYEFTGRGFITYLKNGTPRKRKATSLRTMNVERKSERKNIKIKVS
ncbi:nicotinic acid mononucleotide adenyltransferase [Ascidiimonas aurantiaca]|uniref:nicotinic acid mononucleotide adenyltransferase n=1 Tax=Ascidiimonas aurantiaca TaxID=1685432 RepID=UPI0030EDCBB0